MMDVPCMAAEAMVHSPGTTAPPDRAVCPLRPAGIAQPLNNQGLTLPLPSPLPPLPCTPSPSTNPWPVQIRTSRAAQRLLPCTLPGHIPSLAHTCQAQPWCIRHCCFLVHIAYITIQLFCMSVLCTHTLVHLWIFAFNLDIPHNACSATANMSSFAAAKIDQQE